jgi:hypothetical protein
MVLYPAESLQFREYNPEEVRFQGTAEAYQGKWFLRSSPLQKK